MERTYTQEDVHGMCYFIIIDLCKNFNILIVGHITVLLYILTKTNYGEDIYPGRRAWHVILHNYFATTIL